MKVLKRNGTSSDMKFDKVTKRISNLTDGLSSNISADKVAQKVFSSMYDGMKTHEIDSLSAEISIGMITEDPDYETLASRIVASNIQKIAPNTFSDAMSLLWENGIISEETYSVVKDNEETLNNAIVHERDSESFMYFGLKTLEKSYLQRVNGDIVETPQYTIMRVAIGIHSSDIEKVIETYDLMSTGYFIHATPTLFNAGTPRPQMSSCFLVAMKDDSIDGIYDTLKDCAHISKWAGGIGLNIHNIRGNNSVIKGTNGVSDGIIPMLRVFNATARYVNQAGRRKGSIAIYLEPSHSDIMEFLELRLNQGDEEARARDLFMSIWMPDLFMKRLAKNQDWSLFSPDTAPGLHDVYGEEYEELYERYEREGRATAKVPIQKIWRAILKSQVETGNPNILYKDSCNRKSNQKNLGTIRSSNLCCEIVEYSSPDETAVCNLASLALPKFVRDGKFDYKELHRVTRVVTRNLNKVIDRTFYPIESAKRSNVRHRPIGIGVQGLADVFMLMDTSFDSKDAKDINIAIFETMYHAALTESMELAKVHGVYETFNGCPASKGVLQFDMWDNPTFSGMYDWDALKLDIIKHGLRNSLLVAPMPTASTSQILGNNECFEPYTSNIYLRRTMAGEFVVVNQHLIKRLKEINMWSKDIKNTIIANDGSIQSIEGIPDHIKSVFKTVWEISQKVVINMAADRGCFVDQSQSMNLFIDIPTISKLSSVHMYTWQKGLKTGMYYLRSKPKARAIQFTIDPSKEVCEACSA